MTLTPEDHSRSAQQGGKNVVLGVSGGIAAYKACELLRRLRASGHDVTVVATESALKFVGAATFEALSGHPVATDVFTEVPQVRHVATRSARRPGDCRPGDRRPVGPHRIRPRWTICSPPPCW